MKRVPQKAHTNIVKTSSDIHKECRRSHIWMPPFDAAFKQKQTKLQWITTHSITLAAHATNGSKTRQLPHFLHSFCSLIHKRTNAGHGSMATFSKRSRGVCERAHERLTHTSFLIEITDFNNFQIIPPPYQLTSTPCFFITKSNAFMINLE